MGLSEEGATADGGESGCAGAGGVEKGGLLAALQAEGLRRGEEVVFADEMRLGLLGTGETGVGETGREVETACRTKVRVGVFGVGRGSDEGAAVVGLGEAGAGGGDSSGAQGVEGGRGEGRGMGPCGLSQGEGGGGGRAEADLSAALFA
jgi:hypothetical protein